MCKCGVRFLTKLLIVFCIVNIISCQDWVVKDEGCRTPDRGVGNCIPIRQCKPMIDFLTSLKRPYSAYVVNKLNAYTCGYEGGSTQVCCPPYAIRIVEPSKPTAKPTTPSGPPDVSSHRNLKLLPVECGYLDLGDKIRNGINASLNEFPWMALLSYKTNRGPEFKCGGTIINERYILTAAHCISNLKTPLIGVRVGEYDIQGAVDCEKQVSGETKCNGPVQDLSIEDIIVHSKYTKQELSNDIGLLRVSKMDLSEESARPVCLPLESARDMKFNYGVVTGWGYTGEGGSSSSTLLRVDLPLVSLDKCKDIYKAQETIHLTEKQLCAGGKDQKDSCAGDSGGPLHAAAYVNGDTRYVQLGIVSFGPKFCGLDGYPGVYTKVSYYMNWILDNMKP